MSAIRTQARLLVSDNDATRQRYSDSQITSFVNEGQALFDVSTLCNYKSYSFPLTVGTTYYPLPSDFLNITRVTRDYQMLSEVTPEALTSRSMEWEDVTGLPTYYFVNFSTRDAIGMYPFPQASSDLGTIRVDYQAYSTPLAADTDIPFNGYPEFQAYDYALIDYAAYKMSIIDNRQTMATVFYQQFSAIINVAKDQCVARQAYRPSMIGKQ